MLGLYPGARQGAAAKDFWPLFRQFTGVKNVRPVACARSGMAAGLRALGCGRMDELLVPPYLGHCVLSALARSSFPALAASARTRGVLVFHQFGFPQKMDVVGSYARKRGLFILNDCAHLLYGSYKGREVSGWGDFTVFSLSKFFPSVLGGALAAKSMDVLGAVDKKARSAGADESRSLRQAYNILKRAKSPGLDARLEREVEGVFGYLPELISFPAQALQGLPPGPEQMKKDIQRRRNIWRMAKALCPSRVPDCGECDVVPFAVPLRINAKDQMEVIGRIRERFEADLPLLHFDFARNMLAPDYRQAVVIGCHEGWNEALVGKVLEMLNRSFRG